MHVRKLKQKMNKSYQKEDFTIIDKPAASFRVEPPQNSVLLTSKEEAKPSEDSKAFSLGLN